MKMEFYTHHKRGGIYRIVNEFKLQMDGEHDMALMVAYVNLLDNGRWVRLKSEFYDGRFQIVVLDQAEVKRMIAEAIGAQITSPEKILPKTQSRPASSRPKSSPPHHAIVPFPHPTLPKGRVTPVAGLESASPQNPVSKESAFDFMARIGHPLPTRPPAPEKGLNWVVKKISEEFQLLQFESDEGWYSVRRIRGATTGGVLFRAIFRKHTTNEIVFVHELRDLDELKMICFDHFRKNGGKQ